MAFFRLQPMCYLVQGRSRGAIYDLERMRLIWLDEKLTEVVAACEEHWSIHSAAGHQHISAVTREIRHLEKVGVGRVYETEVCPVIERWKPPYRKSLFDSADGWQRLNKLVVEVTSKCNWNCKFCDREREICNKTCGCMRRKIDDGIAVDMHTWKSVLKEAAEAGCRVLEIVGGEPLVAWNDVAVIVEEARALGFGRVVMWTNGYELDEIKADWLNRFGVEIYLQVLYMRPELYGPTTGVGDGWTVTERAIRLLVDLQSNGTIVLVQWGENGNVEEMERVVGRWKGRVIRDAV